MWAEFSISTRADDVRVGRTLRRAAPGPSPPPADSTGASLRFAFMRGTWFPVYARYTVLMMFGLVGLCVAQRRVSLHPERFLCTVPSILWGEISGRSVRREAPGPSPPFFFILVTGPRRSLSLKLSDTELFHCIFSSSFLIYVG